MNFASASLRAALGLVLTAVSVLHPVVAVASTDQVRTFRAAYNAQRFDRIQSMLVDRSRGTKRAQAFSTFLAQTHQRLGKWRNQRLLGKYVNIGTRGRAFESRYASTFERGVRFERFVFEWTGGEAKLRTYKLYRFE